jgi:biopolymer transport protein ExbB
MNDLLTNTGPFVYPLGLCSFLAVLVIIERLIALRKEAIIPSQYMQWVLSKETVSKEKLGDSPAGKIAKLGLETTTSPEECRTLVQLEVNRMERGLFLLDVVIAVAPLLGLLGTVSGLVQVFSNFGPESSLPETDVLVNGIALALSTTVMGLAIAIPAVVGSHYLNRKIDTLAAHLDSWVEYILSNRK